MSWTPGTETRFTYDCSGPKPVEGDFLRNPNTGRAYVIERAAPSPTIRDRLYLTVTRLPQDALDAEQALRAWPLHWGRRT